MLPSVQRRRRHVPPPLPRLAAIERKRFLCPDAQIREPRSGSAVPAGDEKALSDRLVISGSGDMTFQCDSDSRWLERLLQVADAARHREPFSVLKDHDVFTLSHWLKFFNALDVYNG
jgi:hypothetical protein